MKKTTFFLFAVLLLTSCGTAQTAAEKSAKAAEIQNAVEAGNFTFKATYAYPASFRSVYLSPYYDVKVSSDTVQAYLPYYGRAYRAPMNPNEGGYRFTSTDFDYSVQQGRRGGNWQVQIRINDLNREVIFYFDVWDSGSARLNVSDADRQPIAFQGNINE